MSRPASFNKTWGENVDPGQYNDETTSETQGFIKTGWEGGSDKKAPSAKTQNYMMRKVDLSMQEVERQGMLSWRNDVPYSAGARTWWHGNVFIARSSNTNVEPQGGSDNNIWYLAPVGTYPTTWDGVSNKPDTATRWPKYSEVQNTPELGTASQHNYEDFDVKGDANKVYESSVQRDYSFRAGFQNGDALSPYLEYSKDGTLTAIPLARSAWVTEVQNSLNSLRSALKSAAYKEDTDFDKSGTADSVKQYADGAFPQRDGIKKVGIYNGVKENPYMLTDGGDIVEIATYSQLMPITTGDRKSGKRVWPDGYCEQWGEYHYDDIAGSNVNHFTINFPTKFEKVLTCFGLVDASNQGVIVTRHDFNEEKVSFRCREDSNDNVGGDIAWTATGFIDVSSSNNQSL